jgi:hypothetical protein
LKLSIQDLNYLKIHLIIIKISFLYLINNYSRIWFIYCQQQPRQFLKRLLMWTKKIPNHFLFCNSCFVIWYFVLLIQFYFISYSCNRHWKNIYYKGWYNTSNKICIKLMVVFIYIYIYIYIYKSLLTLLSHMNSTFYDILHTNNTYIPVLAQIIIE